MTTESNRIESLEKEVKQLTIRLETLVNYLNTHGTFGPPDGRDQYDSMVKQGLAKASLQD